MRRDNRRYWGLLMAGCVSGALGCGVVQGLGDRIDGGQGCEEIVVGDAGRGPDSGCSQVQTGFTANMTFVADASPDVSSNVSSNVTAPGNADDGSPTKGGSDDSGSEPLPTPGDCKLACGTAAADGCGVDNFIASDECEELCANSPTQSQLDCVSSAPCATLTKALAAETSFCGIQIHDEPVSAGLCADDCSSLVGACDPSFYVGSTCQDLCANTPTTTQMACLQTSSCHALTSALVAGASFCGFPAFADGGG